MVVHETQGFILIRGVMHAKPYSSGDAALVFIYSITGVVAPSYDIVWCGGGLKMSPRSRA
jgi:predicted naringenin-chalcone synthase